jgi:hypothetical protein
METPHPFISHYRPINHLYGPLQDLIETPYPPTNCYGYQLPLWTTIRPLPPAIHYTTLHSMADISKQINKSQKK